MFRSGPWVVFVTLSVSDAAQWREHSMWRWLSILLVVPVGLGFLFWSVATAEGESWRLGGAYSGLFSNAVLAYVEEHPDALARSGFQTIDTPPHPCDPLSRPSRGPVWGACSAIAEDGNFVPAWLSPVVPSKVMVRIAPGVWADPEARALLLNLAQDKAAACASIDAVQKAVRAERYGLGCDERQPPNHQVWFNVTAARGNTCVQTNATTTKCHRVHVDDSGAFRVR
jgi:hypothetical protein